MAEKERSWIYGVVPAGVDLAELDKRQERIGTEVWLVERGDLAAIASEPPSEDAKGTRDRALAHARILEAVIVDAPVVPFRFGTIVPGGDDAVGDQLLAEREDELKGLLDRFRDHVQMTVKASYDEEGVLRDIVNSDKRISELRKQAKQGDEIATRDVRVALGELISQTLEARREKAAHELLEQIKPHCVDVATERLENEFMIINAPCLVERSKQGDFEKAVSELADENTELMQFSLIGPMPAYNFIETGEPAPA
jgi:hypothetical protein